LIATLFKLKSGLVKVLLAMCLLQNLPQLREMWKLWWSKKCCMSLMKVRRNKEAALLNGLHHQNIVKLLGVCHQPQAIMLEYVYFDFELFGVDDLRVSSLSDFCSTLMITTAKDFTMSLIMRLWK